MAASLHTHTHTQLASLYRFILGTEEDFATSEPDQCVSETLVLHMATPESTIHTHQGFVSLHIHFLAPYRSLRSEVQPGDSLLT